MKNFLTFFNTCLIWTLLSAQPIIQWQKTFGGSSYDEAYSIHATTDGGYIVTGSTASNNGDVFGLHGGNDFWVLKLNSAGAVQWKKVLGGSDHDWPYSIQQTSDGGYILAGYTVSDDFDVSGYHGGVSDGWVVKLSSTGAIQWQKAFGGSNWDDLVSVQQTFDNGYILVGRTNSIDGDATENKGFLDVWVVKINETGNIQWQKSLGGSKDDVAYVVKQASDGGYIIAGETASTDGDVTGLHGNVDFWVVKLSNIGVIEWQKTLGGEGGDIASDVIQTNDGGYALVGYVGSTSGDISGQHGLFDYWVIKLSSSGELEWQKPLGGSNRDWGRSILSTTDGGYIIIGTSDSTDGDVIGNHGSIDMWIVKLNSLGEILWQKSLGGTQADEGFALDITSDNGFILAGYSWSTDGDLTGSLNRGKDDFWIVKLAPESVGVEEAPNAFGAGIELYPNPTAESISLKVASESSILNVTISDLLGREVFRQNISNGGQLDLTKLGHGLYLVSAATQEGNVFWGKVEKM